MTHNEALAKARSTWSGLGAWAIKTRTGVAVGFHQFSGMRWRKVTLGSGKTWEIAFQRAEEWFTQHPKTKKKVAGLLEQVEIDFGPEPEE